MILVATDEEAYNSIQPYLDRALGEKTFTLNARQIRSRFPEQYVDVFDDFLVSLKETGELNKLAKQWFKFPRTDLDGNQTNGQELVRRALDFMLQPLPANPKINNFEITLEVETGNLIYRKFKDLEELLDFINQNVTDPAKILEEISPKPTIRQIGEQIGFYDIDEDDEDF